MDSPIAKTVALNNGSSMPTFGFGTDKIMDHTIFKRAVKELNYRMFDCASRYRNEEVVGQAIHELINEEKAIERSELFVISKVWQDEVEDVEAACKRSLEKLMVDYLDLYLVHWPISLREVQEGGVTKYERIPIPMHKIWEQMEALVEKGLVKNIGVSNFNVQSLWDMLSYAKIKPVVNEVELHPLCAQTELVDFMKTAGIVPIGYCPIARGADTAKCPDVSQQTAVKSSAEKHGRSGPQVLLNWGLRRGHVVIPRSSNFDRLKENIESLDFSLSEDEVAAITEIDEGHRICGSSQWIGHSVFA